MAGTYWLLCVSIGMDSSLWFATMKLAMMWINMAVVVKRDFGITVDLWPEI